VGHVIPYGPVPILLRLLLAAQPKLMTPVLQVVYRAITHHLLGRRVLPGGCRVG